MNEYPLAQDLIASVQKQALLAKLRELRESSVNAGRASAFTEIIRLVNAGELDG